MALTKKQIARSVSKSTGMSFSQVYQYVDTIFDIMKSTLATGEDVLISGFGRFKVNAKEARKGRNPQTGEDVMLRPRKVVTFKWSGKLKEMLNE